MSDHKYEALGDGDLTPEQLDGMEMWDRSDMLSARHRFVGAVLVRRAVAEIRRHRAAQSTSAERVRSAVRDAIDSEVCIDNDQVSAIADRVASLLAASSSDTACGAGADRHRAAAPQEQVPDETINRFLDPGWERIGRIDKAERRSLWIRESPDVIELCAGREGDDAYVRITPENPQWRDLSSVLGCARFAAEYEDDDGRTLEREATAQRVVVPTKRRKAGSRPSREP